MYTQKSMSKRNGSRDNAGRHVANEQDRRTIKWRTLQITMYRQYWYNVLSAWTACFVTEVVYEQSFL